MLDVRCFPLFIIISTYFVFRTQNVEIAKAEGEKIKKVGSAEAYTLEAVGKAEAERMRMKANVYKSYGEAAVMSLVLEALPKVRT